MSKVEQIFNGQTSSDVMSDVSSDVDVTLTDVVTDDFIAVQLPQGLPLDNLHTEYKKNKRRGTDLNAYFVGHLIQRNLYKRNSINEYVPMNSKVLRDVFGGNYAKYIQRLILEGIVEEYSRPTEIVLHDGTVWKHNGTFSKSAGISKQYRLKVDASAPLVEYKITDKALVKKINNARIKKLHHLIKNNETARKVYESLKKVSIDRDGAIKYIKEKYQYAEQVQWAKWFMNREGHSSKTLKKFINDFLNANTKPEKRKVLKANGIKETDSDVEVTSIELAERVIKSYSRFQSRLRWIKVVDAIQKGNHSLISMTQDKYSGRIYHTFTLTASDLRPFMKLDNQHLIEFDGANCQWMLFIKLCNILCQPSFYAKYLEDIGIVKQRTTQTDTTPHTQYLSMLHNFFKDNKTNVEKELYKLTAYLNQNKLRTMIVEAEAKRGKSITESDAKMSLIKNVLFGNPNNQSYNTYKSVKTFRKAFPTLLDIIIKLKRYWIDESVYGYKEKDIFGRKLKYKAFPRLLQRMESDIFVKGMQDTQCDFLTLHDAIVTNESGAVEVKKTLDRIIEENNTNIKLKYKQYV